MSETNWALYALVAITFMAIGANIAQGDPQAGPRDLIMDAFGRQGYINNSYIVNASFDATKPLNGPMQVNGSNDANSKIRLCQTGGALCVTLQRASNQVILDGEGAGHALNLDGWNGVGVVADLYPSTNNSRKLGLSGQAWSEGHIVSMFSGDMIFGNGFRIVESMASDERDGIAKLYFIDNKNNTIYAIGNGNIYLRSLPNVSFAFDNKEYSRFNLQYNTTRQAMLGYNTNYNTSATPGT